MLTLCLGYFLFELHLKNKINSVFDVTTFDSHFANCLFTFNTYITAQQLTVLKTHHPDKSLKSIPPKE